MWKKTAGCEALMNVLVNVLDPDLGAFNNNNSDRKILQSLEDDEIYA